MIGNTGAGYPIISHGKNFPPSLIS